MSKEIENVFDYIDQHNESRYDNYDFLTFLDKIKFTFKKPFIHITGTNGKGSVANYLNNIYQAAKYNVGLFTSPHFERINECILINNKEINNEDLQSIYSKHAKEINKFGLSAFEVLTYCMFEYFNESNIDLAIIEVGMGGEYDATNIDEAPLLAIINNVSLEHSDILGKSISEIAYTKAGIIKEGCKVLVNIVDDDSKFAIEEVAKSNKAEIHYVNEFYRYGISNKGKLFVGYYPYGDILVNTNCITQRSNVACAIEATIDLGNTFKVSEEDLKVGLFCEQLSGRFTNFTINNKYVIVDGAHNPDAFLNLTKAIDYIKGSLKVEALIGVFRDKNIEKMLALLGGHVDKIHLTTFDHPRARSKEEFELFIAEYDFFDDYYEGFLTLLNNNESNIILVTGSLYFANLFISRLKKEGLVK
jgi:dihydrofolate synthase/folylpolyglutamate synthase